MMVTGLVYDITVPSVVSLMYVHRELVMMMGRGRWRSVWPGGDFCCDLSFHPSRSYVDYGAITPVVGVPVVIGGIGELEVYSFVI
jgi:hypothetical protein